MIGTFDCHQTHSGLVGAEATYICKVLLSAHVVENLLQQQHHFSRIAGAMKLAG
jgi:hypothetical protein